VCEFAFDLFIVFIVFIVFFVFILVPHHKSRESVKDHPKRSPLISVEE
jgi:preprotein translocase subunit YajC